MPYNCSVRGCRGNYPGGPKVSVFSFPKDEELNKKWTDATGRSDFYPTKSSKICELHFRSTDVIREDSRYDPKRKITIFARLGTPRLRRNAVPFSFSNYAEESIESNQQNQTEVNGVSTVIIHPTENDVKAETNSDDDVEFIENCETISEGSTQKFDAIELSENFEINSEDFAARKRWKGLRDCFRREMKRAIRTQPGKSLEELQSQWSHFDSLKFLLKSTNKTKFPTPAGNSTVTQSQPGLASGVKLEADDDYMDNLTDCPESNTPIITNPISLSVEAHNNMYMNDEQKDNDPEQSPDSDNSNSKNRKRKLVDEEISKLEKRKLELNQDDADDPDMNFFKSLLPFMRMLTPIRALTVRIKMQNILLDELNSCAGKQKNCDEERESVSNTSNS